jgi:glycosyltransferase involved in cell wall biosynthesis
VLQTFHALGVVKRRQQGSKDTSPPERIELESRIVRHADRIIATCSDELFELVRSGADPDRVDIVPCGVDLDLFTPDGPVESRDPRLHRAVIVSRFVERKGIGNAISAISRVPGCELVIAGGPPAGMLAEDPEASRYLSTAAQHGVKHRVHLVGSVPRERVAALIRSADVVVCVPWYEPFGIVPLEAMACGVPVVATAVGGLVDTVVDGVTGLHVPPRRPREIARSLSWLLNEPLLRKRLGAAGLQRARARYGWDAVAADTLSAYSRVESSQAGSDRAG